MSVFGFFCGEVTLAGEEKDAARILNLCMAHALPYTKTWREETGFFISLLSHDAKVLLHCAVEENVGLKEVTRSGLPHLFYRYRHRIGLMAGFVIVAVLMVYASMIVWRVQITGNERLHRQSIEELLAAYGIKTGRFIPFLSLDEAENKILLENPDIAWISLHLSGTTLHVELRETRRGSEHEDGLSANLVASTDGLIERIEALDGRVMVKVGDTIKKGDVLVSGLYDNSSHTLRMTAASGAIYARTVRDITVTVPFEYEKKVYLGRVFQEKTLIFFGNEIKVFTNTGKAEGTCDIIYYEKMLPLGESMEIPVGMRTRKYLEYTMTEARYTEEEAMNEAFRRLSATLRSLAEDTELLRKDVSFEITDEAYILKCRLVCVENIAVRQKIEVAP